MHNEATQGLRVQERDATLFASAVRALTAHGFSDVTFDIGGKKSRRRFISALSPEGKKITAWIKFGRTWPGLAEIIQFPWKKLSVSPDGVAAAELASEDAAHRGATHLMAVVGDETSGKLFVARLYELSELPNLVARQEPTINSSYYRAHSACLVLVSHSPEFGSAETIATESGLDLLALGKNPRPAVSPAGSVSRRSGFAYRRDEKVRARVLEIAGGCCECCKEEGFLTSAGKRYLETHHVVEVSERGPDDVNNVVAVCPLCHRKAHFAANRIEIERRMFEAIRKRPRLRSAEQIVPADRAKPRSG